MTTQLRTSVVVFALAILGATACGDEGASKRTGADVLAQDTTLDLNIALANEDSVSQAELNDVTPTAKPAEISSAASTESESGVAAVIPPVSDKPVVRRNRTRRTASRTTSSRRVVPVSRTASRAAAKKATRRVSSAQRARTAAAIEATQRSGAATSRSSSEARSAVTRSRETSTAVGSVATGISRSSGERTGAATRRTAGVIAAGSELSLESGQRVCTNTNNAGDRFEARLAESVTAPNGSVIPRGATATGEISSVRKNGDDDSALGFRLTSLSFAGRTYRLNSEVTYAEMSTVPSQSRAGSASKIAIGAGAGAVLGRVLGRSTKSTVIGAIGGAAAGSVLASRTSTVVRCVPDGGRITARLTEPLTIGFSE